MVQPCILSYFSKFNYSMYILDNFIKCNFFSFTFTWNLYNETVCRASSKIFGTVKYDCVLKRSEMFNFIKQINVSTIIGCLNIQ